MLNWKVWTALFAGLIAGFMASVFLQGLLEGMQRSWAKRTALDCRSISAALEQYRADNGYYPPLDGNIEHLRTYLIPKYLRRVPIRDMSNHPFLVAMNGTPATVISVGRYGAAVEAGTVITGRRADDGKSTADHLRHHRTCAFRQAGRVSTALTVIDSRCAMCSSMAS